MKKTLTFALLCALVLLFASCALDATPPAFTVELYEGSNPVSDEYLSYPIPAALLESVDAEVMREFGIMTVEAVDTLGEYLLTLLASGEFIGGGYLTGRGLMVTESQFESIVGRFSLPAETTVDEFLDILTAEPDPADPDAVPPVFEKKDSNTLTLDVNAFLPIIKGIRFVNIPDGMTTEEVKATMQMMLVTMGGPDSDVEEMGINPDSILNATISDDGTTATFLESFIMPLFDSPIQVEDGYIIFDLTAGP